MQHRRGAAWFSRFSATAASWALCLPLGVALMPEAVRATTAPAGAGGAVFEQVQARARDLAAAPFDDRAIHVEDWLLQFDYDDYREIEYRREKALWEGTEAPYRVQFHHRGGLFPNPVKVHLVGEGVVSDFKFDPALFNYRNAPVGGTTPPADDLGFAGFKVLAPVNSAHFDEVLSFLGASYFRGLGAGNHYGLSARGLAINASKFGREEFPWFREFWIEEPLESAADASADAPLRICALLDSQSVTGAYQFELRPGDPTTLEVRATLFIRRDIEELGLAPLTSMYLFGETDPWPAGLDFRPEVHDSDGLAIHYAHGERLWRPLQNPQNSLVSDFPVAAGTRGFGLLQRDRDFGNYQDLEAVYQRRPTCWIEPTPGTEGFGGGTVRLLELSSMSEANDSTVAYFVPSEPVKAGQVLDVAYRMHWGGETADALSQGGGGYVASTRPSRSPDAPGPSDAPGNPGGATRFVLELDGEALDSLPPTATVTADVTVDGGLAGPPVIQPNPFAGTWRLFFDVAPSGPEPATIRAYLKHGEHVASETWSFRCVP